MIKHINGYRYELPHLATLREIMPGVWQGHTLRGKDFCVLGGSHLIGKRRLWYVVSPDALHSKEPMVVTSLADGLRKLEEVAALENGQP